MKEIIKKYQAYIQNIEWHIRTNKPKGENLDYCRTQLKYYKEILNDLLSVPVGTFLPEIAQPLQSNELSKLIRIMTPSMQEQFMRHDYRSMWEIWQMIINENDKVQPTKNKENDNSEIGNALSDLIRTLSRISNVSPDLLNDYDSKRLENAKNILSENPSARNTPIIQSYNTGS